MRNVLTLFRVQWMDLVGLNRALHDKDRKRRAGKVAMRLLIYFAMLLMLPLAFLYAYGMAAGLHAMGMLRMFPALALAAYSLISLCTSMFKANGMLFGFRDFDLVMSLPVSHAQVVASRVLTMYCLNLALAMGVMIPCGAAYAWFARPAWGYYPVYLMMALLAPLIPITLGCALGALASRVAVSFRSYHLVGIVLLIALTLGIMALSMRFASYQDPDQLLLALGDLGGMLSRALQRLYPPSSLFTQAICDLRLLPALAFAGLSLGAFLLFCLAFARLFQPLNARVRSPLSARSRRGVRARERGPLSALYRKEMGRYFASTIYVVNTAIGPILALVGVIALAVMGPAKLLAALDIPMIGDAVERMVAIFAPYAASFMIATACTTASSISLEGKNLWLVKTAPVPGFFVLLAKLFVNLTVTMPIALIASVILVVILPMAPARAALVLLFPQAVALFAGLFGLEVNLKQHAFDWRTETAVVKQSPAVLVAMLGGFAVAIGPMLLAIAFLEYAEWIGWAAALMIFALDGAMLAHMRRGGDRLIRQL